MGLGVMELIIIVAICGLGILTLAAIGAAIYFLMNRQK